jgi:gluconate 2-dehydrogenase gamma chain
MNRDETRLPHSDEKAERFSEKSGAKLNTPKSKRGVTRRRALKVLAAGAAGAVALKSTGCMDESETFPNTGSFGETTGRNPRAAGTLTDPDLITPVVPWDLALTKEELETLAALCDVIIPGDERSPSASTVDAHGFIDEWVSAPYEGNQNDLVIVRGGLVWLGVESTNRFGRPFVEIGPDEKAEICDDICYEPNAAPEFKVAARFFDKVRDLTSTAFWTTDEGMADLGFVGNRPMPSFEGPPPEVLRLLRLI